MTKFVILAAIGIFFLISSAAAQTAEETVLFIAYGLEDGFKDKNGSVLVRQTGKGTWQILEGPQKGVIQILRASSCRFSVVTPGATVQFDFDKVKEIDVRPSRLGGIIVKMTGPQMRITTQDGQRISSDEHVQLHDISLDRYNRALAYFRTNFCKGRAF
jgi:hypothetical protein